MVQHAALIGVVMRIRGWELCLYKSLWDRATGAVDPLSMQGDCRSDWATIALQDLV